MADTDPPELTAAFKTISDAVLPSIRTDGWNGARQRRFLEAVADGDTVRDACRFVGLSTASAYAYRRTAKGRAFDLGWKAADLLARERVAADLLIRAVEGQEAETERPDGSVHVRRYKNNRLALQMLNRLDRYADASDRIAPGHAARLVAGDFDAYLDLVGADGGPARAGLYTLARGADGEGAAAELEPVLALARADRLVRCGTAAGDLPVADLDPARRAEWTAEQWARAEAAGIVALAPAPPPPPEPDPEPRPAPTAAPAIDDAVDPDARVWFDLDGNRWLTDFPPPADFDEWESGDWEDRGYHRELTDEEQEVAVGRLGPAYGFVKREDEERERDRWFGAGGGSADPVSDGIEATPPSPAGGPDAGSPDPFDAEGEAALALLGAGEAVTDATPEPLSTRQPRQHPAPEGPEPPALRPRAEPACRLLAP